MSVIHQKCNTIIAAVVIKMEKVIQKVSPMKNDKMKEKGVTLIEILLVLVIISAIIWGSMTYVQQKALQTRIDKTSIQMQQILNAGLAYYVANGKWPISLDCLKGDTTAGTNCSLIYLPENLINNAWGDPYVVANSNSLFYVHSNIISTATTANGTAFAIASTLAGVLPLSYVTLPTQTVPPTGTTTPPCTATDSSCMVVASVNIPGENLNRAGAVNFAGLYHHGACVPVPTCPVDMTGAHALRPQIMVVPVSINGINIEGGADRMFPLTSFTAYATGPSSNPPSCGPPNNDRPVCAGTEDPGVSRPASGQYWRACAQVITELGDVAQTNAKEWGIKTTLMAITRCAISGEPAGSKESMFSQ